MKRVIFYSGGLISWYTAHHVINHIATPDDEVVLLFADTRYEDEDVYRFIRETAAAWDGRAHLVTVCDGRNPWEIFKHKRLIGNSRIAPCSELLKKVPCSKWVKANCTPDDSMLYIGFDAFEDQRHRRAQVQWAPYTVEAPCVDLDTYEPRSQLIHLTRTLYGIEPPSSYLEGWSHANCGQRCVRGGQKHWVKVFHDRPEKFAEVEQAEQGMREYLERDDISMLKSRVGGEVAPYPLSMLRAELEASQQLQPSLFEGFGGCGCFGNLDEDS